MRVYFLATLIFVTTFSFGQSSSLFVSDDKLYRIFLPDDWIKQTDLGAGVQFSMTAPDQNNKDFKATFQLETGTLKDGFQNASIEDVAKQELEITKQQAGEKLIVIRDSFLVFQNKKSWNGILSVPVTKKTTICFWILKTIHNKITYTLSFSAPSDYFTKNLSQMYAYMSTMMFYTSDLTDYRNAPKTASNARLKTFAGTYFQKLPDATTKIVIAQLSNGNYDAKEIREIIKDGKTYVFETTLQAESIVDNVITLSSDAVINADPPIMWAKASYQLKKSGNSLAGKFFSKNNAFEAYDVELAMQGQPGLAKATTGNTKVSVTPKPANQANKVNSGATNITDNEKNHVDVYEIDFSKEGEYIMQYGDGKVQRQSEHQIEFTLTNGKKKSLKDLYDNKNKSYEAPGCFIGYSNAWTSFIIAQQGGGGMVKLVNRATGDISDIICLNDIEQSNNAPGELYGGINLHRAFSPDQKWLAVERISTDDDADLAMELVIYAVQPTFVKKYKNKFEVTSFQNSNIKTQHWEPGELTWLDNKTLDIKKVRRFGVPEKEKVVGTTWLTLQNDKWVFAVSKPGTQQQSAGTPASTDLENGNGKVAVSGKPASAPAVTNRVYTGGKTMDELGQKLLLALKSNDKKMWYSCIQNDTYENSTNDFTDRRERFEKLGLADWSQVKYIRTSFSNGKNYTKEQPVYTDMKVEFTYGSSLIGFFFLTVSVNLYNGKYLLNDSPSATFGNNLYRQ